MPASGILQRLKERKLVQWTLAYLAGAFVVFQAIDPAVEAWQISPVLVKAIHILLFFGLLITPILAWYHGEKGRQSVSGPELLMVAALLVIAGVAISSLGDSEPTPARSSFSEDGRPGIAVMPCENFSPNSEDEFFAGGIHEEILLRLAKISALRSIGRESMEWYRDNPVPMREMAEELGVGFVGECSVRKDVAANEIRVTFQLIDANTGSQLWAEKYDASLSARRLFDIHSDIARRVARELEAELSPEEQEQIQARPTENLDAYNAYLTGRYWWSRRSEAEAIPTAIRYFQEAIEADSSLALAYAGLADSYTLHSFYVPDYEESLPVAQAYEAAHAAVEKSLELDPKLAEAHASLGAIRMWFEWDWDGAEEAFNRAIELSPSYGTAHFFLAHLYRYQGRFDDALVLYLRARQLDPLSPQINRAVVAQLAAAGRFEEAISQARQHVDLFPGVASSRDRLSWLLYLHGDFQDAIDTNPTGTAAIAALLDLGRSEEARVLAETYATAGPRLKLRATVALGDLDSAIDLVEEAFSERAPWLVDEIWTTTQSWFRGDPRIHDVLVRMNLAS